MDEGKRKEATVSHPIGRIERSLGLLSLGISYILLIEDLFK
jgi:hypothetical protein